MTAYDRKNPSPDYRAMVAIYETLHEEGESVAGTSRKEAGGQKILGIPLAK